MGKKTKWKREFHVLETIQNSNFSVVELASILGKDTSTLRKLKRGHVPNLTKLIEIANVLDLPLTAFYSEEKVDSDETV